MVFVNVVLTGAQAALWRIGGAGKEEIKFAAAWYRDVLIPVINFLYFWFTMDFLTGILTGGATNTIRIGYGAYDPEHDSKPSFLAKLTKDREGWKIRMIYGGITAFGIGLFPALHNGALVGFLLYIILNVIGEGLLNRQKVFNVWITEPAVGALKGLVFFLCK